MAPVPTVELAEAGILEDLIRPYTLTRLKNRILNTLSQVHTEISDIEKDELQLLGFRSKQFKMKELTKVLNRV
jgi:hypothetical protein